MKNILLKKAYVLATSTLIFMLHLPFVFAMHKPAAALPMTAVAVKSSTAIASNNLEDVYDQLNLGKLGLSEEVYNYAIKGYTYLLENGEIDNSEVISIVDFTKPSTEKRLFVIDLEHCKTLFNTYVAHGQGSGSAMANRFSNIPESYQSSLGFYVTEGTYTGKNGYSLHLEGMESGINDKAEERAIVMHGAPYVSESFIKIKGYLGRSWGCPAVPEKLNRPIIEKIKNGSCLFVYGKNNQYIKRSKILNS